MSNRLRRCTTCNAPIIVRYTQAGERMPLDLEEMTGAKAGMYVVVDDAICRPAEPMFDPPGTTYHSSHLDTCPDAAPHRRNN